MLNVYIHRKIDGLEHLPILSYYFGSVPMEILRAGNQARTLLNKQYFILVDRPEKADYFLIPHSYYHIKDEAYIEEFVSLSTIHHKKILVFSYGDSDEDINIPNSIIFRSSQYRYKIKKNEIIFPAIADDLSADRAFVLRDKSPIPVVGFCGWAEFENTNRRIKEYIKLFILYFKKYLLGNKYALLHTRGIILRRKALFSLKRSGLVETNFVIRDSYSGSEKTRKINAEKSRAEYIENIVNSDFSLAIKGDGNFSIRFYEVLSLGRIPLFVDTDCVLPLEDVIDYSSFIIKTNSGEIPHLGQTVSEFYNRLSVVEFKKMQNHARSIYENYLRVDKYAEYVFLQNPDFLKKYE
jgi:hypothetical protein